MIERCPKIFLIMRLQRDRRFFLHISDVLHKLRKGKRAVPDRKMLVLPSEIVMQMRMPRIPSQFIEPDIQRFAGKHIKMARIETKTNSVGRQRSEKLAQYHGIFFVNIFQRNDGPVIVRQPDELLPGFEAAL